MTAVDRQTQTGFRVTGLTSQSTNTYAMLDAAGLPNLTQRLAQSAFEAVSLHVGDDAIALEHEAPYILHLDPADENKWAPLVNDAASAFALVLMQTDVTLDDVRRHWRKWLSVQIEGEGKQAMFRFYDPRVMAAFIMTLAPTDVMAYFGPIDEISVIRGDTMTRFRPTAESRDAVPTPRVPGALYNVSPIQVDALADVVSDQFKDDLFRFYRKIFAAETASLDDATLRGRIEQAIADTRRQGPTRRVDVLRMSAVRVLRPDLADDDWIWNEVMTHETNNPLMRSSLFLSYMKFEMSESAREEFEARFSVFGIAGAY